MLEVRELSYGILKGVSFTVPDRKIVGVVGRNGAGKTTLLKCLGGFYGYLGSVKVSGREVRELPPATNETGMRRAPCLNPRNLTAWGTTIPTKPTTPQ